LQRRPKPRWPDRKATGFRSNPRKIGHISGQDSGEASILMESGPPMRPRLEADMVYPERFSNLPAYAFPRLRSLLDPHEAGGEPLAMTIGEPQHPFPAFVGDILAENLSGFAKYPPNDGAPELLAAITGWLQRR
jgi:hypothetical protein